MRHCCLVLGLIALVGTNVQAAEVAGVELAEEMRSPDGARLLLNGAGVRKKFFIKVYVGALYLPQKTRSVDGVLNGPGARRVAMHFVYDGVSRQKITDGWSEGMQANLSEQAFNAIKPRLEQFNALFEDMRAGDTIVLDYVPAEGTRVEVKGREKGVIPGEDFMQALFKVWLGGAPVDAGLKRAMLGLD